MSHCRNPTVCQRVGNLIVWMHDLVSQFRLEQTGPVTEITMGQNGPIQSASQYPKFFLVVRASGQYINSFGSPGYYVSSVLTIAHDQFCTLPSRRDAVSFCILFFRIKSGLKGKEQKKLLLSFHLPHLAIIILLPLGQMTHQTEKELTVWMCGYLQTWMKSRIQWCSTPPSGWKK